MQEGCFTGKPQQMAQSKNKRLMGTDIRITIFWEKDSNEDIERVFKIFHVLEEEFSRFKSESSLSLLNTKRTKEVSDTFIDVLKKCKEIYSDTNGYFNPLINVSNLWYSEDFHSKKFEKTESEVNLELENVEIKWKRITLQQWQNLDLGWIVKWYAVDKAREYLDNKGHENYIIDAWGDIYTAWSNEQWWKIIVGIDSPFISDNIFATIEVENTAIATSGTYKRKWKIEDQEYILNRQKNQWNEVFLDDWVIPTIWETESTNKVKWLKISKTVEYNHIINPMTAMNNNEIISITLIGDNCYLSDAYATACIAMWLGKTLDFLKKNHMDGVIVCTNQKTYITEWMKKYNVQFI